MSAPELRWTRTEGGIVLARIPGADAIRAKAWPIDPGAHGAAAVVMLEVLHPDGAVAFRHRLTGRTVRGALQDARLLALDCLSALRADVLP